MKTIRFLLLRGLPGSGKSTFASQLVTHGSNHDGLEHQWKRLNKDSMREMVDGGAFSPAGEALINDSLYWMAEQYLLNGYNVVSDNMNFQEFHFKTALHIVRRLNKMKIKDPNVQFKVSVKDFYTPIETCIERDAQRVKPVTAKVIRQIEQQYLGANSDFPELPSGVEAFYE